MDLARIKPWGSLNWPNRISLLRLLMVVPFVIMLMNQRQWPGARYVAMVIFAAMALSDVLDGYLARRLGVRTRLGAILDPLADKVMIICATVLLSLPDSWVAGAPLANWVVVTIVGKDLWVIVGFVVIYLVTDRFRVHPTTMGKACTFSQSCMVALTLLAPDLNLLYAELGTWIARLVSWGVALLCVVAAASYTLLGLAFVATEEKPLNGTAGNPADSADEHD
ncbi:MAG TPA: CDP-alcohol phosphatidyltransferase family protein [Phycisphaerae bacterium]|nr:CDP-alcohol phosphatidyltransferase family protein [Phycisphaerae bacterium]HUT58761.1 CDP-alcohol phosphatidyltransferase family protein [Phycisphaerae bacterium]